MRVYTTFSKLDSTNGINGFLLLMPSSFRACMLPFVYITKHQSNDPPETRRSLRPGVGFRPTCMTYPEIRLKAASMGFPFTKICPFKLLDSILPAKASRNVVFDDPEGPAMASTSLWFTGADTLFRSVLTFTSCFFPLVTTCTTPIPASYLSISGPSRSDTMSGTLFDLHLCSGGAQDIMFENHVRS